MNPFATSGQLRIPEIESDWFNSTPGILQTLLSHKACSASEVPTKANHGGLWGIGGGPYGQPWCNDGRFGDDPLFHKRPFSTMHRKTKCLSHGLRRAKTQFPVFDSDRSFQPSFSEPRNQAIFLHLLFSGKKWSLRRSIHSDSHNNEV